MTTTPTPPLALPALPKPYDTGPIPKFSADQMNAHATAAILSDRAGRGDAAGWVSVEDRLPELGEIVLGWNGALSVFSRDDVGGDGWLWARQSWAWNIADPMGIECDDDYQVTHWQQLPTPPAAPTGEAS